MIRKPLIAAAEAADLVRVGRSGVYRSRAVRVDQDRPFVARIGRAGTDLMEAGLTKGR